ncbi:MAG: ATP-binding cassette domain-containing protein [Candidatus Melainabacteria bacterium]|nr:ATP-binding cassette domain-containing protein [Candidatus Melainabacteria bacterium]MBI3309302.1 ATP-binding cassette domain-containing protein [Candidatus Melainabacteria bacterium]
MPTEILVKVKNLTKKYPIQKGFWSKTIGHIHALNNVSLDINKGEIIGIVGESGCGKSTLGKLILRLLEPSGGEVFHNNVNIFNVTGKELRSLREKIQIVFQNPYSSLNPRMKIKDIVAEPLIVHKKCTSKKDLEAKVTEILGLVGLEKDYLDKYPHQLSGGQRQRIAIARTLSLNPEFLVLDEPVSALDVSIQAQILNLLLDLQKKLGLTYLFISHDLSVVSYIANKIAVMYLGHIVEVGSKKDIIQNPQHPYTKALLSAAPKIHGSQNEKIILKGDIADPSNIPSGCVFRTRCPIAKDKCKDIIPNLEKHNNQLAACHYAGEF